MRMARSSVQHRSLSRDTRIATKDDIIVCVLLACLMLLVYMALVEYTSFANLYTGIACVMVYLLALTIHAAYRLHSNPVVLDNTMLALLGSPLGQLVGKLHSPVMICDEYGNLCWYNDRIAEWIRENGVRIGSSINSLLSVEENKRVRTQYAEATKRVETLQEEAKNLSDKVTLAAQLDATNIRIEPRNKRGKETNSVKSVIKFVIDFTIVKNITAATGERTIYVRIAKPDGSVLTKDASRTFKYENTKLEYSIKKLIEYTGEEQAVTVYWDVEEFLNPGQYTVYLFSDGVMIGERSFTME